MGSEVGVSGAMTCQSLWHSPAGPEPCVGCDNCGFTYAAMHGPPYTCPACAENRLEAENQRLREALKALRQSVMNRRAKLGLSGCICCGYDYCIEGCPLLAANALSSKEESDA